MFVRCLRGGQRRCELCHAFDVLVESRRFTELFLGSIAIRSSDLRISSNLSIGLARIVEKVEAFVMWITILEGELPTIGPSGVSVPAYYYKVIVDLRPAGVEGIGFILPNGSANQSIGRYAVSIDSVEAFTGIDFFPVVADSVEEEIEGNLSGEHWGLERR